MSFTLRSYQQQSVDALFNWFTVRKGNPLLVLPTGAGKSIVQAGFIKEALAQYPSTRIIMASHVKELLQQNADKVAKMIPGVDLKFCSAGIGQKAFSAQVLVCGIQTAYKYADRIGHCDLLFIDEAQLLADSDESMYRTFLGDLLTINPRMKVIGMTATPYRLSSGMLYGQEDSFFSGVAHEVHIRELLDQGHLTRLVGRKGITHVDLNNLHTRGGEFIDSELQARFDIDGVTKSIVSEVIAASGGMHGILIFASGVEHAHHLAEAIGAVTGERVEVVSGTTARSQRENVTNEFKQEKFRWLINFGVYTTGFDAPHVDLIVLCRATKSTGLYIQICGRGMRLADGKEKCIIMDYGGNINRHGPIDRISPNVGQSGDGDGDAPVKECPECLALLYAGVRECPECGHEFPPPEPDLEQTASEAGIMSDENIEWQDVQHIEYRRHQKQGGLESMRVTYHITECISVSEWICFNHTGFARRKAEQWSERRKTPSPANVDDALQIDWPTVCRIKVDNNGKFPTLLDVEFGEIPGWTKPEPPPFDCSDLDGGSRTYNPDDIWSQEELDAIPF